MSRVPPFRRLAIFDFDGTIADSAGWFFGIMNDVARRHGFRQVTESEREMLRGRSSREIIAYLGVPAWRLPAIALEMRGLASRDIEAIRLFPWVESALDALDDAGIGLAIASSNSEANIRRVLGPALAGRVALFATGASLFGKAAKLRQVIRASGTPAGGVTAIGDEVRDIEAARKAGIRALAVGWGYALPSALQAAGPDLLLDDPGKLVEAILAADPA